MSPRLTAISITLVAAISTSAFAADDKKAAQKIDWQAHCQSEMKRFKCDAGGTDEAIYQCLLKHDADLSKTCDNKAHAKYEELTKKKK